MCAVVIVVVVAGVVGACVTFVVVWVVGFVVGGGLVLLLFSDGAAGVSMDECVIALLVVGGGVTSAGVAPFELPTLISGNCPTPATL